MDMAQVMRSVHLRGTSQTMAVLQARKPAIVLSIIFAVFLLS